MSDLHDPMCSGCYRSFFGDWWCDNCDQWPCLCEDDVASPSAVSEPAGETT